MPASPNPSPVDTAPYGGIVSICLPVASPEARCSDPTADRSAHEDIFTFVRAMWSDRMTIEAMFKRCSVQALHRRFFRPLPSAPHGYVEEVLGDRDNHHSYHIASNGLVGGREAATGLVRSSVQQRRA